MTIQVGKVAMVPITSIIMEDRVREVYGDLEGLESNMKESGLITPLAVKDNKDDTYKLLAGGRRYTVLLKNLVEQVPVRIYEEELTELEMKVIEKAENFHRKDMEYWEMDRLTLEIHQMQQQLHGVKAPGPNQSGWSTSDTGEILGGVTKGAVSQAIKRAEAREVFPELFESCKSASDASKVLKKVDEAIVKQAISQKIESSATGDTLQLAKNFVIKSLFEGIKDIPDKYVHLVEIDPPYAINLNKSKMTESESKYVKSDYNEIDVDSYIFGSSDPNHPWKGVRKLLQECYRVMTEHSWLIYWFAPEPWFEDIYSEIKNAGFSTTRMCGIWVKPTGQSMQPATNLANKYEMFFYARKGQPALNKPGSGNIFNTPPINYALKTHPTERPIELMKEIYDTFSYKGSRVLIPCLGSGNGIISAHELGMTAFGFELSKGYKDSFLIKLNSLK